MFRQKAFTIIELMVAILVVGVLSTLAVINYNESILRSNFKGMREIAARFALSQQEHRQRYGIYANTVSATGTGSSTTLIFSEARDYTINVSDATFRQFVATIQPNRTQNNTANDTPEGCRAIQITSTQGYLSYISLDSNNRNTTSNCMPNG